MMSKFFILLLLLLPLQAEFSALLKRIEHNDLFHFSFHDIAFSCEPAMVITLTKLYNVKSLGKVCKEHINSFVKEYPYVPYQAKLIMHEEQKYMIKPLRERCFIMLNSGISFSEHMIEKGFAILPKKPEPELIGKPIYENLKLAQKRAQYHKRGVWQKPSLLNCFAHE